MYQGIILHILAKISFILGSYMIHFFLGNYLSPAEYGLIGTIITIMDLEYLLLNNGVRQSISNAISSNTYDDKDIIKKGLILQGILILIIALFICLFANQISNILGDRTLTKYIIITLPIIIFMGLYFALLGIFNGLKDFKTESKILIVYPILKLSVIPFVLFIFQDTLLGTEAGFIFSAFLILIICIIATKKIAFPLLNKGKKMDWKTFINSTFTFSLIFIAASIIMNIDLLIVKATIPDAAYAGYYTGATNFSKIPYYLLTAIFLVVLPVITTLYIKGEQKALKQNIIHIIELVSAAILPIVVLISVTSSSLLPSFYKPEYINGAPALSLLIFGTFFLGSTIILNMIISAMGRKKFTLIISIFLLIMDIVLCLLLTHVYHITGAAFSSFTACGCALIISFIYLSKITGCLISKNLIKILFANALLFIVVYYSNKHMSFSLITLGLFYIMCYCSFIAFLFLAKIIHKDQLKNFFTHS